MKKIISWLTNPIIISLIGLIALSVIVWIVGPMVKFGADNAAPLGSETARLITIIVLLVLWGLNNLRIQMVKRKQNEELVGDLQQNQEAAPELVNDQSAEELHQLSQRFSDALATLSRLKFRGRGRRKGLYELPWYIIIGPPGSGKTTALVNSSLEFPLADKFGQAAMQGVGGTRNCDWWFTNEAVLIDTAGRYTTQDSHRVVDSSAWDGFLSLLRKHRRRRPINGAIVAISIQDLLSQSDDERAQHARIIRTRIDELMQKLQIRFPVYLLFTKSDLVPGFSEFFEDLGKEDREQVWGVSLPNAPDPQQSPDFDFICNELQALLDRLFARELARVHQERDVRRRAAIQGFPQQLDNLKPLLEDFVRQAFAKNRFEYQPYLRGVYFTSGTQDGTPIDRMMSAVAANFGFARDNLPVQQGQGKSFFLGRLFREVIFPEAELVGSNRRYEMLIRWGQRGAYVLLALVAAGLIGGWAMSLNRHQAYMAQVDEYVTEFGAEAQRIRPTNHDVRAVLPALNALARASIVYDQAEHPWLSGLGLYDDNVDVAAGEAYQAQLRALLLPRLIHYLETRLRQQHEGGDLYHNFKTYLMFSKTEYRDKRLIEEWFSTQWKQTMQGEGSDRLALEKHLQVLLGLEPEPVELNPTLVEQTRRLLLRVPVHQRIYSRIRTQQEFSQPVELLNLFGESVRQVFVMSDTVQQALTIPFMFTREGYERLDLTTESPMIADIVKERWVLSDDESARVDFVSDDLEGIANRVRDLYMADFVARWSQVLGALKVSEFNSVRAADDALSLFVHPVDSPLLAILQVTADNTRLSPQLAQDLDEDHGEGKAGKVTALLASKFKGTPVDQSFRPLNNLLRTSSKRPAPVDAVIQQIQQLNEFISEVSVAPEPGKKAFEIARARFQGGAGNAMTSLTSYAKSLPEPVKGWMQTLADQSWKVVLSAGRQHVNNEWKSQVYAVYRQGLAGRYPLNTKASSELAMQDFSDFFKPGGILDKFHETFLKPFINTRKGWTNRSVDGRSLGLGKTLLVQLRRAQQIKSIFFRKNPELPSVSFQLKPDQMNKTEVMFQLDLGPQRLTYSHGPKFWKEMNWAGDGEHNRVRILFQDRQDRLHDKTYNGPWAFFRLQDDATLSKTKQANIYQVEYSIKDADGKRSIRYLLKADSVNNPFTRNLLGAFSCPASI